MGTHMDALLEYIFGVDAGKTGHCTVNTDQYDTLESDMKYTGGVGGRCIKIRQSIEGRTESNGDVSIVYNELNMFLLLPELLSRT